MSKTVYEIMTENVINRITESIKSGKKFKFVEEWTGGVPVPTSYTTQKSYRGINAITLKPGEYITFTEVKKLQQDNKDIAIRKGCHTKQVFYTGKSTQQKTGNIKISVKNGQIISEEEKEKNFFFTKYYSVFDINDVNGIESKYPREKFEHTPNEHFKILDAYLQAFYSQENTPEFRHEKSCSRAYFSPTENTVNIPLKNAFPFLYNYYNVVLHETTHSTIIPLKRKIATSKYDTAYSYEELIAETGALLALNLFGIVDDTKEENNIAYLQGWLNVFKQDTTILIKASNDAQKAVKYFIETAEKTVNIPEEQKISRFLQ